MKVREKYINAVFKYDVEAFKHLLETEEFDRSLLSDINISIGEPCPLPWITQCWEIIFEHPERWKSGYSDIIKKNKTRNLEIKNIFKKKLNADFQPIDFYSTDIDYLRDARSDTFEDIFLGDTKAKMLARGHREIDLDLYVEVSKFHFEEVERLLKLGANPDYWFDDWGSSCTDTMQGRCFLPEVELWDVISSSKESRPMQYRDVINLVGLAACNSMLSLFERYRAYGSGNDR